MFLARFGRGFYLKNKNSLLRFCVANIHTCFSGFRTRRQI